MLEENREKKIIGDKMYNPKDYDKNDPLSKGLAETHEQATDAYTEGTIDALIERENGDAEKIPKKGYE